MALSKDTGELTLDGGRLGPKTTRDEFIATWSAAKSDGISKDGFTLVPHRIDDRDYRVIARFRGPTLAQLTLVDEDPAFGTSWDDYSTEKEMARLAAHDRFLESQLGAAHERDDAHFHKSWTLAWGKVWSSHDPRGTSTAIQIVYRNPA